MLEKFDETCSDTMLRLSALDVIKLDMLHKNNMLPHAMSPVHGDYHYNNNDNIHLFGNEGLLALCTDSRKGSRQMGSLLGHSYGFSPSVFLPFCFWF